MLTNTLSNDEEVILKSKNQEMSKDLAQYDFDILKLELELQKNESYQILSRLIKERRLLKLELHKIKQILFHHQISQY